MPADANIYANLLRQPKSVQDYDALAMQSQSNMLALDEQRMKAQALKQAQADELAYKNAVKGFGGDVEANYRNLLSAGLPKHAADYQKAALEGREKQAKIGKEEGESLDAGIKRYRDQLSYIESPEAAARWYQAQYADPVVGKFLSGHGTIDQALKEIPSDPAAFKMWRDQIGMGLDAFNKKLQEDTKIAETGRHNKATEGIQERNNIRSNARMTQNGAGAAAPASATPAPAPKPAKPLPAAALKMQQESLDAISTSAGINADLGGILGQIQSGKLKLGPVANAVSAGKNFAGMSDTQSQNYASFKASLEKLRNDSLRLNKGVQTDGDAQRAWNELLQNINDPGVVQQRLREIQALNERAIGLHQLNIDTIRNNYGAGPLDTSDRVNQKPAIGAGQQPNAKALSAEDQQAAAWARANPNDPRAALIKQKLGL